jgi:hypothetical protein
LIQVNLDFFSIIARELISFLFVKIDGVYRNIDVEVIDIFAFMTIVGCTVHRDGVGMGAIGFYDIRSLFFDIFVTRKFSKWCMSLLLAIL